MCAWNQPCSVSSNANVNASNRFFVPSQTKRHRRGVHLRPEDVRVARADRAVDAVAGDHEVGVVLRRDDALVGDVGLEHEPDAELLAAGLQDVEQPLAADAAEAVTARRDLAALEEHVDVVPVVERLQDRPRGGLVGGDEVAERLVGENDAPAERVVRPVALDDDDFAARILLLHQQAEIQAGRPAADACDVHGSPFVPAFAAGYPVRRAATRTQLFDI